MVKKLKLGLALGSGGWRGLAHIGVIKVLEKAGVKIDFIAGSSVGALVGGLYAALGDINKVQEIVEQLTYGKIANLLFDFRASSGLVKGEKMRKFLEKFIGRVRIEDLPIPYRAVTTDLFNGKTVAIGEGELASAILASAAVPVILQPVKKENRFLVDGGASMPVPVSVVKKMGADVVMAVMLYSNIFPVKIDYLRTRKGVPSGLAVGRFSFHMLLTQLARRDCREADLTIEPKIDEGKFDIFFKFVHNEKTVVAGEKAMKRKMAELKGKLGLN